jgi:reactive chlorine resistance protein C
MYAGDRAAPTLDRLGAVLLRYGLVLVLAWIGALKFTAPEAQGIVPLVERSPFLGWAYGVFSVQGFSNLIGAVELAAAALLAVRFRWPRLSAVGSLVAIAIFLTTLSFLFSTPGWDPALGGFPALSGSGQFLVKDVVLLAAAVWTLADALAGRRSGRAREALAGTGA